MFVRSAYLKALRSTQPDKGRSAKDFLTLYHSEKLLAYKKGIKLE